MLYYVLFFLLFASCSFAEMRVGTLNQNNDHQFWAEQNINIDISEKWSLILHTSQRFGDDYKRFFFFRQWTIAQYDCTENINNWLCVQPKSLFDSFTIGPGFSKVWSIRRNTREVLHWANSNHYCLVAFMTHKWHGWELRQRMVGEYIDYATPHYDAHGVYRHRATVTTPWQFTCLQLNPFLSNEWFFREETKYQSGPYYENRFRFGLRANLVKHLTTELWWQLRTSKQLPDSRPLWRKTYQIGLTINVNL